MPDTERALRACDLCAGVDNHPRHVYGVGPDFPGAVPDPSVIDAILANGADGAALREVMDATTVVRHFDCCAEYGCPDGSCHDVLRVAGDRRREALVDLAESGGLSEVAEVRAARLGGN